jgi:transcriptional regulator with XRE-family HTH domain
MNTRRQHTHLYTCLGKVVTDRRKRLGMSQQELADDAGVDRAFISNIERGKRNPSFGTIALIAGGLKMRYARLVHNCEECMQGERTTA